MESKQSFSANKLKILGIPGSLRQGSYNKASLRAAQGLTPALVELEIFEELDKIPPFSQDLEDSPPEIVTQFKQRIRNADAILFATPEYNYSVPGVLKNAIDVGSRPYGKNSWDGKPGAVVSVSISSLGGFGANHHLRQSLVFVNVPAMPQPEAYIASAQNLFNDKDELINDSTKEFLESFMTAFERWVMVHTEMEVPA